MWVGLVLGVLSGAVHAEMEMVRYDSYADDGEHISGGYFSIGDSGLGQNNCMAMVYSFEESQYPLTPTGMNIFWAGGSEAMMRLYVEWYEGTADEFVMAAGALTERLEQERFLVAGIDLEGTWQELDFATEGIEIDFDPEVPGVQPITHGSLVMSICYVNEQMFPEIAMDNNGFADEVPLPDGEAFPAGQETSRFRSLIYWNGLWLTSDEYLRTAFGFEGAGDFIMRLLIETNVDEDEDPSGCVASDDWNLNTVSPSSTTEGTRQQVLISGDFNFPADSTVTLGAQAMLDVAVNSSCGVEAFVDPSTPAGTYDVIVSSGGTQRAIENGFTVEASGGGDWDSEDDRSSSAKEDKSSCASARHQPAALLALLALIIVPIRSRRRRS